jgi:predicted DNA-binding transcriptional regulator AlpA
MPKRQTPKPKLETTVERFLTRTEIAELTGFNRSSIWRMERGGLFPRGIYITGKKIPYWPLSTVEKWMEAQRTKFSKSQVA